MQYLSIDNCAGQYEWYNQNAPDNSFPQMDNVWVKPDRSSYAFPGKVFSKTLNNRLSYVYSGIGETNCTFTNATNTVNKNNHNLINGTKIKFVNYLGAVPTGLSTSTTYYVVSSAANTFQVSLTYGGAVVTFSDDGSGSNWYTVLGVGRGLFQYLPTPGSVAGDYLMCFQTGRSLNSGAYYNGYLFVLRSDVWTKLTTTSDVSFLYPFHASFEQFSNKVYMASYFNYTFKWHADFSPELPAIKDKTSTTGFPLVTGATLTWNLVTPTTVTSDIDVTGITPPVVAGSWIRKSSDSIYWDEVKSVSADGLTITLRANSLENGASAAGGAEQAPILRAVGSTVASYTFAKYCYVISWKEKLWLANDSSDVTQKSVLRWSVTGDPESWSETLGGGSLIVGESEGEGITGLAFLGENLFVFKDKSYYVYTWTGDLDEPITLTKKVNFGCISHETIKNIGDALIYYSGSDVRITDGSSDLSLTNNQLPKSFEYGNYAGVNSTYFSLTTTANSYPFAVYDENVGVYRLYFGTYDISCLVYDIKNKAWIGREYVGTTAGTQVFLGRGTKVYSTASVPVIVRQPNYTEANQLTYQSPTAMLIDSSDGAVVRSKVYNFGTSFKKKKIYWIEFAFFAKNGCSSTLSFSYWDNADQYQPLAGAFVDVGILGTAPSLQTFTLQNNGSTTSQTDVVRRRHRFLINQNFYEFAWYLKETVGGSSTAGWGVDSITIAYDFCETT